MMKSELKIFSGNGNPRLAQAICDYLRLPLGQIKLTRFCDGEVYCQHLENVRGTDVFFVQPTCHPVNENLMELLIAADTLKRSSAARVTAVIPYYGYARQDRKDKPRALRLWDTRTGAQLSSLQGQYGQVLSLDWSPSGELLASGGSDGLVYLWDTPAGQLRQSLGGHTDQISDIAWSAAGDRLATTSLDGTTRIWDPFSGEELIKVGSYPEFQSLDWSSHGDQLASISSAWGAVRIWDLASSVVRLAGHAGMVNDAQWSPDGNGLLQQGSLIGRCASGNGRVGGCSSP